MDKVAFKAELRKIIADEIANLPHDYIVESNSGLLHHVTSLDKFINARNIMLFYSVGRETDTLELAKVALASGKQVAFPFCFRGGIMQAREIKTLDDLKPAILGIPAPSETAPIITREDLELIIVPALTYDKAGFRLGYGGGYYDRYLADIHACTIGLARERLIREELPREPHDIEVNYLVTETSASLVR